MNRDIRVVNSKVLTTNGISISFPNFDCVNLTSLYLKVLGGLELNDNEAQIMRKA